MTTHKTGDEMVREAKGHIAEISPQEAVQRHGGDTVFLDVREPNEWNLGHVPGAIHIPRGYLEDKVESLIDRGRDVIVYCAAGARSALAADTLRQMGYERVASLRDGIRGWVDAGGEIQD